MEENTNRSIRQNLKDLARAEGLKGDRGVMSYLDELVTPQMEVNVVPPGKYKVVYRVVTDEELKNIDKEDFLIPLKGSRKIFFGMSDADAMAYSAPLLCEVLLKGGTPYNAIYDGLMGTSIGWVSDPIPTYLVRCIGDVDNLNNQQENILYLVDINERARNLHIHMLDVFYYVKKNGTLPESVNQMTTFYQDERAKRKQIEKNQQTAFLASGLEDTIFLKTLFEPSIETEHDSQNYTPVDLQSHYNTGRK